MAIQFNADEIFEIAEQIERNGAKFYRRAAKGFDSSETLQLLGDLAIMEDQHEQTFSMMRKQLGSGDRSEMTFDPYGEAALYLKAMADGYVFNVREDPSNRLTGEETLQNILTTAIGLEKDSIVFYLGIKELVPAGLGRDKIDGIIKQEMGHVTILTKHLAALEQ
ncbi:MAG TPA: ferritin family protein [bacterium]|nr:ferritin family protein [bacterium]